MDADHSGLLHRLSDLETRQPRRQGLHFAQLPFPVAERPLLPAGRQPRPEKEHGFTYDAGLSFATGRDGVYTLRGEATWFDSYIDNWIVWLPTAKGFWTPKNVKEVHAYGVEVKAGLDVQLAKDWQLSADGNFSWTPSINHGDPVDWYDKAIGKQLVYIPEFSASVTGHLTYRSWRFTYKWCYYSERFTTSDNDMKTKIGRVKPYFMSDISLEKPSRSAGPTSRLKESSTTSSTKSISRCFRARCPG